MFGNNIIVVAENFISNDNVVAVEVHDTTTIRCPCDKCRNLICKKRSDVRFDLLKWGLYANYTTWELHGEIVNHSNGGHISEISDIEGIGHNDSEVNMLEDAFGVPSMHLGRDEADSNNNNEEPKGEAAKFYRLLNEYQEPLTVGGTTMSKLSYIEHLKVVVAHGESKTQEEILLDVLTPRSGYFRGKGTALPGFSKGRHQLEHQSLIREQQKKIQEQQELIKELQENQERTTKQLEETQEATARQLQQQKEET
uniref:Transposase-associated domain-containing protein n=1 Tax=Chenopodium quinoa TaxID=63459 RepID=A0A803LSW0_CHEQI